MDNLFKQIELQERAAKEFGFYWEKIDQILDQVKSECDEVLAAWEKTDRSHLEEEVGDLLQAAISLAVFCDLDAEAVLKASIEKFQKRYDDVVKFAKEDGLEHLQNQSFDRLMDYWNRAKLANEN